jgi:8-oxo-dGTP diphosphatase
MALLRVVAAAVVESSRLLLVSKHAAPDVYYLPGGKPEPSESALTCLHRELREELGVGVSDIDFFADVRATAALEEVDMLMTVFRARLLGEPAPAAEIASLVWWPHHRDVALAPAISGSVIPGLRRAGLL